MNTSEPKRKRRPSEREAYDHADYCACGCSLDSGRNTPTCQHAPLAILDWGLVASEDAVEPETGPAEAPAKVQVVTIQVGAVTVTITA